MKISRSIGWLVVLVSLTWSEARSQPAATGLQQQSVSSNKRSLALTYGRCDDRDQILENFPDHKYYSWGTAAPCASRRSQSGWC